MVNKYISHMAAECINHSATMAGPARGSLFGEKINTFYVGERRLHAKKKLTNHQDNHYSLG